MIRNIVTTIKSHNADYFDWHWEHVSSLASLTVHVSYILISTHSVKHGVMISYLSHVCLSHPLGNEIHWNSNSNLTDMFDSLSKDHGLYRWECSIKMYEILLWWRVKTSRGKLKESSAEETLVCSFPPAM
jgi:hypothetical protein